MANKNLTNNVSVSDLYKGIIADPGTSSADFYNSVTGQTGGGIGSPLAVQPTGTTLNSNPVGQAAAGSGGLGIMPVDSDIPLNVADPKWSSGTLQPDGTYSPDPFASLAAASKALGISPAAQSLAYASGPLAPGSHVLAARGIPQARPAVPRRPIGVTLGHGNTGVGGGVEGGLGPMVRLASGTMANSGLLSTNPANGFTYKVMPDGSILNTTTGRITATAKGPVGVAAVANAKTGNTAQGGSGASGYLNAQGTNTSGMTAGEVANAYMKSIS